MGNEEGTILPIEDSILRVAVELSDEFHGFQAAKHLQEMANARRLTAHGVCTLGDLGFADDID